MADHDPSWMILDECKELDLLPSEPTLEMMGAIKPRLFLLVV